MAPRAPAFDAADLPGDIRLMNLTATLLGIVAVVALVATLLVVFARQPLFELQGIRIEGELTRNSEATIRANAAPRLAGNFFTMDLAATRRAFESVPWVRRALVQRVWPNRLRVRLEEHRAVALWRSDSGADKLVDVDGEVFEVHRGDADDNALPILRGPDGSTAHMLGLLGRLRPVLAGLNAEIETLTLSGRGSWRAELDSGAQVELGRGSDDEVVARAGRFVGTLGQVTARFQRPLEYADLRHNDAYAIRLRGVTTSVVAPPAKPVRK